MGEALAPAYASSDIFVFPSDSESFGMSHWKRWRPGLPTVCADATGSRSRGRARRNRLPGPARDAEAFTRHVTALVQDEARAAHGRSGRAARLEFSWEGDLGADAGLLRALLAGTPIL